MKKISISSTETVCDGCGKVLGASYPTKNGSLSLYLNDPEGNPQRVDSCSEACMYAVLKNRAEGNTPEQMSSPMQMKGNVLELDMTADESFAKKYSQKQRENMDKSDFLYPETKSYPIKSCQDIKNAISSFGRGNQKDSYDTFIHKLYRKAKSLGLEHCIPESTKKEHNLE